GLTPEQYRIRWNLPADYPMVAPEYAQKRSRIAKRARQEQLKSLRKNS
ncbi:MAG TPA: MucR family transcriptional regulator, partial [Rhizobiaceae bacterium]|nr:MucR family transcriptional regulator [Rhizobiaceae bacterium]